MHVKDKKPEHTHGGTDTLALGYDGQQKLIVQMNCGKIEQLPYSIYITYNA